MDFYPEKKSVLDIKLFNELADKKNLLSYVNQHLVPVSYAEAYANAVSYEDFDYSKYGDKDGVFLNCSVKYTENGQTVSAKFKMIVHFFSKKYRLILRSSFNVAGSSATGSRHQVTEHISGDVQDRWLNTDYTRNPVGSCIISTIIESNAPIFHKWANINSVHSIPAEYSGFSEPSLVEKATYTGRMTLGEILDIALCGAFPSAHTDLNPVWRYVVQANEMMPNEHYTREELVDGEIRNYENDDYEKTTFFNVSNISLDTVTYTSDVDPNNRYNAFLKVIRATTNLDGVRYSPSWSIMQKAISFPGHLINQHNNHEASAAESVNDFIDKLNASMKEASAFKNELSYSYDGTTSSSFLDEWPPIDAPYSYGSSKKYIKSMPFGNYISNTDGVATAIGDVRVTSSGWPFGMFGGGSGIVHNNFVTYRGHHDYFMSTLIDYDNSPHFNSIDDWKEYIKSKEWMNEQN